MRLKKNYWPLQSYCFFPPELVDDQLGGFTKMVRCCLDKRFRVARERKLDNYVMFTFDVTVRFEIE